VYVNGFDISMFLRSVAAPISIETTETTTLVNDNKTYIPSLADATLSAEGLYDGSQEAFPDIMEDSIADGAPSVWLVTHARTVGATCYGLAADETSLALESPAAELVTFNVEAQSRSFRENGHVVKALQSEVGAGAGTALDYGRATPAGAVYLQALKPPDGASPSDCAAAAQHSVDGVTWVDLATFTVPAAGKVAQRVDIPGQINRFTRANWSAGAGGSAPFVLAVCRRPS
jgi:hypothetical protein